MKTVSRETTRKDAEMLKMSKEISSAVITAMQEVAMLKKGDENKFANYKYTSIDDFLEALRPKLAKAGLVVLSNEVEIVSYAVPEVKGGKEVRATFNRYVYEFYLASPKTDEVYGPIRRSVDLRFVGAQTSGQAQSYSEKMFLRSLLKVATGDKDADDQEQGNFTGGVGAPGNKRTGNKVIDGWLNEQIGALANAQTIEDLRSIYPSIVKQAQANGCTADQIAMLSDQKDNRKHFLEAQKGVAA